MGLTDLILAVQSQIPKFLTLTIGGNSFDCDCLHIKINDSFIPLDGEDPLSKINDLIDLLHNYSDYKTGDAYFPKAKAFTNKDYFKIDVDWLYEISRNIGQTPVVLFISKSEWYVDVMGSGLFYPLRKVTASEFIDYLERQYYLGVIEGSD